MPTLAYVHLTQTKFYAGIYPDDWYGVWQVATNPVGPLATPFKVAWNGVTESATVAEYADVVGGILTTNPLNQFKAASSFSGTALAGDVLTLTDVVLADRWGLTGTPLTFTVTGLDGAALTFAAPFRGRIADTTWTLKRGGVVIAVSAYDALYPSATALGLGETIREDATPGDYLDSQFLSEYKTSTEAITHISYVQTMVKSLADAIRRTSQEYLDAAPGNPIVTDFLA